MKSLTQTRLNGDLTKVAGLRIDDCRIAPETIARIRKDIPHLTITYLCQTIEGNLTQENLLREADLVVFPTEYTRRRSEEEYCEEITIPPKTVIIPNGSDFHKYYSDPEVERKAAKIRSFLGKDSQIISYFGWIPREEEIEILIEIFDEAKKQHPMAKLLISHRLVPRKSYEYGEITNSSKHKEDIILRDEVTSDPEERAAYLKASNVIYVRDHHLESDQSQTALEAIMMGTPVIIDNVDGNAEFYVKPQLAYETPRGDIKTVNRWLKYLFEDPARARGNAEHNRQRATRLYNLEAIERRIAEAEHEVMFGRLKALREGYEAERQTDKIENIDRMLQAVAEAHLDLEEFS